MRRAPRLLLSAGSVVTTTGGSACLSRRGGHTTWGRDEQLWTSESPSSTSPLALHRDSLITEHHHPPLAPHCHAGARLAQRSPREGLRHEDVGEADAAQRCGWSRRAADDLESDFEWSTTAAFRAEIDNRAKLELALLHEMLLTSMLSADDWGRNSSQTTPCTQSKSGNTRLICLSFFHYLNRPWGEVPRYAPCKNTFSIHNICPVKRGA